MTAYLGDKPVCLGGVKAIESVAGKVLHDKTLNGDGRQEPLGVDTSVMATMEYVHNREEVIRGDMVSLENVYTKDEVYKILEDYLPLVGKKNMSGWIGFDGKYTPNGNQALIAVQTASGVKGLIGATTDDNGMLRDVAVIDKLKGTTAQYTTVLATQIGSVTNHIPRIFAKKISSGTTHSAIDIPEASGTMARLEDIPDTYTKEEIDGKFTGIEEKIPESASATNQLATKADLKDINLDGYVKKSGDTMTGDLGIVSDTYKTSANISVEGARGRTTIRVSDSESPGVYSQFELNRSGEFVVRTIGGTSINYGKVGAPDVPMYNVYTKRLNNGANLIVPTEGGTLARLEDLEGIGGDSLPDQTGNTGKFLMTDGENASWGSAIKNGGDSITGTYNFGGVSGMKMTVKEGFGGGIQFLDAQYNLKGPEILSTVIGIGVNGVLYNVEGIYAKTVVGSGRLIVPTEGGTLARIEDINAALGDISTALTAILGE